MKNFTLSVATVLALSTFAVAGGDIAPVVEPVEEVATAVDDSGFYIGGAISFSNSETDESGEYGDSGLVSWTYSEEIDDTGFMLQAGYQFNKYLAIEGRYWNVTSDKKTSYFNEQNDNEPNLYSDEFGDMKAWGIYIKPMYPITDSVSIYGLLGYGNTNIGNEHWWEGYQGTDIVDENGFQWGIGASYAYDEHISIFVDYVQLATDAEESIDFVANGSSTLAYDYSKWESSVYTINLGISYKF